MSWWLHVIHFNITYDTVRISIIYTVVHTRHCISAHVHMRHARSRWNDGVYHKEKKTIVSKARGKLYIVPDLCYIVLRRYSLLYYAGLGTVPVEKCELWNVRGFWNVQIMLNNFLHLPTTRH